MAQWVDLQSFWPRGFCFPFQTAQKCVTLIWLHRSSGKEKESRCLVFWPSTKRQIRHFHAIVLRWRQRNVQKSAMHVQIVFLRLQRGFPNIVLRKKNIHEHWTRVTRFNPLWVFEPRDVLKWIFLCLFIKSAFLYIWMFWNLKEMVL